MWMWVGTTLLLIARDTFQEYEHATKAVFDPAVGLLSITPENFSNLYTLGFKIGGVSPLFHWETEG